MTQLYGVVHNHTPYVLANVTREGVLRLATTPAPKGAANFPITVDTGFTGSFSLPERMLRWLSLDFLGYESYILADGSNVETPTFQGRVLVGQISYPSRFILGRSLPGVEFMETAFSTLNMEFRTGRLTLG